MFNFLVGQRVKLYVCRWPAIFVRLGKLMISLLMRLDICILRLAVIVPGKVSVSKR